MHQLWDKLTLFLCCLSLLGYVDKGERYAVAAMLLAITLSALFGFFESRIFQVVGFTCYAALCIARPECGVYLPLLFYDLLTPGLRWEVALALPGVVLFWRSYPPAASLMFVLYLLIAFLMQRRTHLFLKLWGEYWQLHDSAREQSLQLQEQNRALMEKQDYEVRLATLQERNRIAREIHDNVGHLLTSAILQTGALMAVHPEEPIDLPLGNIKNTLSEAMDSVRRSVHDLHDDAVDLYTQLYTVVGRFDFCPARLRYEVERPPDKETIYCFVAVVKEALSNVMKHSDARNVLITVREHPALYQLFVEDDGTVCTRPDSEGIGVLNMRERVESLGGRLHITREKGYRIFVSVPKGEVQ